MADDCDYEEPVVKLQTTGNLEECKRSFVNKEFVSFKQEIQSGKFKAYEATYKYSTDYDGSNELVIRNRVSGLCQNFGAHRRYCFIAIKCHKLNNNKYLFTSYWIVNTDIKELMKDDYDDYDWNEVDLTDYVSFENKFKEEPFAFEYVH